MADLVTRLLLNNTQFDNNIRQSTQQVHKFKTSAEKASKNINTLQGNIMRASTSLNGLASSFTNLASKGNVALATLTVLGAAGIDSLKRFAEFEQSMKQFQGILGICTEEMKYFNLEAIRLGATTTQTASQVAKAFTMIAGRLPQLLNNKEALVEVTEAAITLAEAATMTVDEAGTALANSLNQMGAKASSATKYINILAAGSRNGAGNIIYLTEAMKKIGNTTASVKMSFEQTIAAIEMLAKTGVVAGSAGRLIRAIIGALEKQMNDELKPSIVGIDKALENLGKMSLTTADYFNMFGVENQGAARTLVESRGEFKKLTEVITGTNTAIDQAKTNTDNLKGAITRLDSAWEELCLTVTGGDFWKNTIDGATKYLGILTDIVLRLKDINSFNAKQGSRMTSQKSTELKQNFDKIFKELLLTINPKTNKKYTEKEAAAYINTNRKQLFPSFYDDKVMIVDSKRIHSNSKAASDIVKENLDRKLTEWVNSIIFSDNTTNTSVTNNEIKKTLNGIKGKSPEEIIQNKIAYLDSMLATALDVQTEFFVRSLKAQLEKQLILGKEESITTQVIKTGNPFSIPMVIVPDSLKELAAEKAGIIQQMNNANSPEDYIRLKVRLDAKEEQMTNWKNGKGGMLIKGLDVSKAIPLLFDNIGDSIEDNINDSVSSATDNIAMMSSALGSLQSAMLATGQSSEKMAKSMATANAAASIAMLIATMVEKTKTSVTIWDWIAGATAGVATVITLAAQLKSVSKFANGGIVGGNSTIGDMNLARVNAGEMILNNHQLRNLFNLLNNGGASSVATSGTVEFKIEGKQLVGVLNNYNHKVSKVR